MMALVAPKTSTRKFPIGELDSESRSGPRRLHPEEEEDVHVHLPEH